MNNDRSVLRELAEQVAQIADKKIQSERREQWRALNSLRMVRPMVNVNYFMWWQEVYPDCESLKCQHPAARAVERDLRQAIFHDWIGDDTVIEPWVVLRCTYGAPYINTPEMGDTYFCSNAWGLPFKRRDKVEEGGSWAFDPALAELADFKKMLKPSHVVDYQKTAENVGYVRDCIGDMLGVVADTGPMIRTYTGSILSDLCLLRGLENVMIDIYENPEWLHEVIEFMTQGVHALHEECERAGDLRMFNTFNQSMTYCDELEDPSPSESPVVRRQLWHFYEGQEFDCVSPQKTDEFCIRYHKMLAKEYGMVAYGCCEDLTRKIDLLRSIPNLRCIAVTPWADTQKCAQQIKRDYVMSWRPNPASTLCNGLDEDFVYGELSGGLRAARECGCNVEINLKDVKTIRKDIYALKKWVQIAMDLAQQ